VLASEKIRQATELKAHIRLTALVLGQQVIIRRNLAHRAPILRSTESDYKSKSTLHAFAEDNPAGAVVSEHPRSITASLISGRAKGKEVVSCNNGPNLAPKSLSGCAFTGTTYLEMVDGAHPNTALLLLNIPAGLPLSANAFSHSPGFSLRS